jgi:DNA (cytosine-5)-methyltransferase 1
MELRPLVTGKWNLKDLKAPDHDAPIVFSCFAGGGGSSMGYKLAGFKTLGYCEIDDEMSHLYDVNLGHDYMFRFKTPIQELVKRPGLLNEIQPDVLDGSPPCSSFSMAGSREDAWGEEKVFREGQKSQILDDLFFHFIDVADKLKPNFVVAENVTGMLVGKAKGYIKIIRQRFEECGYKVQLFELNASKMGVPQARRRLFFVARRSDLPLGPINFSFTEPVIPLIKAITGRSADGAKHLTKKMLTEWYKTPLGSSSEKYFQLVKPDPWKPCPTVTSQCQDAGATVCHPTEPRKFSTDELIALQSFPDDYQFGSMNAGYVMGMSVPPLMMQRVATEILRQWILPLRARRAQAVP